MLISKHSIAITNIFVILTIQYDLVISFNPIARTTGPRINKQIVLYSSTTKQQPFIDGPPQETKPNYEEINGPLGPAIDRLFLSIFRSKMAEKVGIDSKLPYNEYSGLMELTTALNARFANKSQVQNVAQDILSMFIECM